MENNYMYNDYTIGGQSGRGLCPSPMTLNQYYQMQEQINWYNEYQNWLAQQSQMFTDLDSDIWLDNYIEPYNPDIKTSYCLNCEKNCVIDFGDVGFTKCMACKDIIITNMKQIRSTYVTKTRQNKINNFTKAINEYLQGSNINEVQQFIDIFTELLDFIKLNNKAHEKLPNMNSLFFIEKILLYLGYSIKYRKTKTNNFNNNTIWYEFISNRKVNIITSDDDDCGSTTLKGVFPANSIKSPSLRL